MHFYNGIDAAKRIGISYKTLLRWIEKGKLRPETAKTPTGQLVISGDQVEAARREVAQERAILGQSKTSTPITNPPGHDIDSLILEVQDLERRVSELEKRQPQTIVDSHSMSVPVSSSHPSTTKSQPQTAPAITQSSIPVPTDFPLGTLHSTDFAASIGMDYTVLDGYIRRGVRGDKLDVTEVPHATRAGYRHRYFTPDQQKKAIKILKIHKKL